MDDEVVSGDEAGDLNFWLERVLQLNGSDLILVEGFPASIKKDGKIEKIGTSALSEKEIEDKVLPVLTPHALKDFKDRNIADSSYSIPDVGRFRINLHKQKRTTAATIRALPNKVPSLEHLSLPVGVESLLQVRGGLVIIGGPAGSGKSTTLAALVNEINRVESRHIIVIEDPIEYQHQHDKCIIEQIEIGDDAPDYPTALRASLRQAPDLIVIGEMRDPESVQIALAAAETGHTIFTTLHTTDVTSAIARIADSFPIERQNTIRQELAIGIAAVFVQHLLPRASGGRIPAGELLMVGYGARTHIRKNTLQHLHQEITLTKRKGSFTVEDNLAQLVKMGEISKTDALGIAVHTDELNKLIG